LEEYHLLLQALQAGFGTQDRDALAQLCCTLWIKSEDEQQIFQDYFDQLVPVQPEGPTVPISQKISPAEYLPDKSATDKKRQPFRIKRSLMLGLVSCLALVGGGFVVRSLIVRPHLPNPGTLEFQSNNPFCRSCFQVKEKDKKASIRIVRTGGSLGEVGATIYIDEDDDYWQGLFLKDNPKMRERISKFLEYLKNHPKDLEDSVYEYLKNHPEGEDYYRAITEYYNVVEFLKKNPELKEKLSSASTKVLVEEVLAINDIIKTHIPVPFANGKTVEIVKIPIRNDTVPEFKSGFPQPDYEKVTLHLGSPKGGALIGQNSTVSIDDQDDVTPLFKIPEWLAIILLAPLGWLLLNVILKMLNIQRRIRSSEPEPAEDYTNLPRAILSPEVIRKMADEIQVAEAIRHLDSQPEEPFPMLLTRLPVTYRQMKQGWRHLRSLVREGVPTELDLDATVDQICRQGFFLQPVLRPRRINKMELLLLIDRNGSMVPFHQLSQGLINSTSQGGRFSCVRVHYFHNCPSDYLYQDPFLLEAEPVDDCLADLPKTRVVCVIFSDAGAARGGFNSRRRRLTKFFLKDLKQAIDRIAWLNPVPRDRWESTTAGEIADLVPMFELNRQALDQAIDWLRGRYLRLE
jgi:uncharacterized protein with von Willebrand factor type A (vWA) domain